MTYDIKRGDTIIATVKPTGSQQRQLMGKDIVSMNFTLSSFVQLAIWDTVEVYGKTYILNQRPTINKVSSVQYDYTAQFEAQGYDLAKISYNFPDVNGNLTILNFPLTGNADTLIDLIVRNMNREDSGWTKGTVDDTDYATLSFSGDNCLSALNKIAQQFNTEFWIDGKTINLTKQGQETTLKFQYGKGNGLYSIQRSVSNNKNVFSRLYVAGSTKNIPADYRGGMTSLQLPGSTPYIQKDAQFDAYGLIETSQTFDGSNNTKEIYPHRTGTVSAIADAFTISDSGMDFDLNDQLVPGVNATLHFQTGNLAGYEFAINSYDSTTKTFVINPLQSDNGTSLPDANGLKPAVGDTYVLLNIIMPDTYITAAENELQTAANEYYDTNADGREVYSVSCDPIYFKDKNLDTLNLGDFVTITDTPMGIDRSIRLIGIQRDLQMAFKYTLTLADTASVAEIVRQYFDAQNTGIVIRRNGLQNVNKARRNWRNTADLENMIFDPEGDYYTSKIKPASIETLYLAVGAKAQNFSLNGVVIKPNLAGNPANMDVTAGQLVHYSLSIEGLGSVWQMAAKSFTGLDADTSYYLFARIDTTALTGTWVLKTAPVTADSETGFWNLGVGVLFSVENGYRDFEFNKGMTYIVGDTITSGRIQSIDAQNYFDLTQGKFNIGTSLKGMDWNVTAPDQLTIRGAIVQNAGGETSYIPVDRGAYQSGATYYPDDSVYYNGSTWKRKGTTNITGQAPADDSAYWTVVAAAGTDGIQGPAGADGQTSYFHVKYSDNADGNPMTDTPSTYIGTYVDFTQADSTDYTKYTWSQFEGSQGPTGEDGIPGTNGTDGQTSYLHIKYSDDGGSTFTANDGETAGAYIGQYVDFTQADSTIATDYTWAKIKGDQGVQGPAGANGETLYTWVKYADDDTGTGISDSSDGKDYIGLAYNKTTQTEGTNPADYTWSLFKGDQGIQGPAGANGETLYTWIKYADSPTTGMSDDPTGKAYLGIAYNKTTPTEGTNYSDYLWSKIQGVDGTNGSDGADGNWVEIRFAKNGSTTSPPSITITQTDPTGWTTTPPSTGSLEYLWMTKALKSAAGSLVEDWSAPVRIKGDVGAEGPQGPTGQTGATGPAGADGADGATGPSLAYLGAYSASKTYSGSPTLVQAVKYTDGNYYVTRVDAGSFSDVAPTDTSKWNEIGASFEMIATGLLLAQLAYIENLVVSRLSTSADTAKPRIVASDAELDVFDVGVALDNETAGNAMIRIGKGAGIMNQVPNSAPGIALRDTAGNNSYTENSSEGIFSNGSGVPFLPSANNPFTNATIVSLLQGSKSSDPTGISAAVVGIDQTDTGEGKSYAAYLGGDIKTTGQHEGIRFTSLTVTGNYNVQDDDVLLCVNNSCTVYLPASPQVGKFFIFQQAQAGSYTINGNGNNIIKGGSPQTSVSPSYGMIMWWDGTYWRRFDESH